MLVEARAGKPITSPTAKMCGTLVWNPLSTVISPRSPVVTPAAASFSRSTLLSRPAATSTVSIARRAPEVRESVTSPVSGASQLSTRSSQWKTIPSFSIAAVSACDSSRSRNGNRIDRPSMTWTSAPRAANVQAYSLPITPAPTTARLDGR
jgi:hypothetical protein